MKFKLLFLLVSITAFAQDYPKDYFRPPLDIPLQLSGNFGELRSNHFHAGLDFRTQQKEGFNVYASAEGYVSRIKISPYGYGKAIYITHPNGYTTLYGHLKSAAPQIESYIKAAQYKNQSFEIEVFPTPEELPIKKGQMIALSGNTGGSEGPHLHFEIRDTKSEKVINPMYFGFNIQLPDTKKPVISTLVVYPVGQNSVVNKSTDPFVINLTPQGSGTYVAQKISAMGNIGFGIAAYDTDNVTQNRNGIFEVATFFNGKPTFGYRFDTYHFDESRYINALIDFPRYKRTSQRIQKLFMKSPFPLSLIKTDDTRGIIAMAPNTSGTYRIEVSDFNGNKSTVSVPLEYAPDPPNTEPKQEITPYFIEPSKDYNFEKGNMSVFFPAGTFYEEFYLDFDVKDNRLLLNNKNVPVHTNFTITVTDTTAADPSKDKTFIALMNGNRPSYNATIRKDNLLSAKVKALGIYALAKDTIKPTIAPLKKIEGKWLSADKTLQFIIKDDLSGIREYKGWLNGKFILFEYDYKNRRITHDFDDNIADDGRNDLKIMVTDMVGNSAIFETHFFRSKSK